MQSNSRSLDEPSTLLALGGLGIIAVTVGLLMWNKVPPMVAMVVTPILGALLMGFAVASARPAASISG
ncbi:hypothetical protein [Nesterenkonia massiliensis]|uniref:hypothetical protein n=1 Tax=Nesterenkonia massiliensis TaxID=1232429 RepID=UPI0013153381|nr:hypothetical protein [Nesterenkonia massiliensis]